MTNLLSRLRSRVVTRDPEPLQSLFFAWASRRGKPERLTLSQERLLESVNESPCLNRKDRTVALGWSIKKFQSTKDALEELDLLQTEQVTSGPGRPETFLVLTDAGYKYLRRHHIQPNRLHGSLEHHCAILRIQDHFDRAGYKTSITQPVAPDAIVDLLCTKGPERGAVEVIHTNNVARDAAKCARLADELDWIHLVATSRELMHDYASRFANLVSPSVRTKLAMSFLAEFLSPTPAPSSDPDRSRSEDAN